MSRVNWDKWNDWLTEHYVDIPTREIAKRVGCTPKAVQKRAARLGLSKFPNDISFFRTWTPESAYVIGLWAADGYVNVKKDGGVVASVCQTHGGGILDRIQELVGRGPVYDVVQYGSRQWVLRGRNFYTFLNETFGHDVQAKSLTLQWPRIPFEFERDFIRGFCDGDGHVGEHTCRRNPMPTIHIHTGSREFCEALVDRIAHRTGIEGNVRTDSDGVHMVPYTNIKAICLARWLYQPGDLAMPRKMDAAQKVMSIEQSFVRKASLTPKMHEMFPDILSRYTRETRACFFAVEKQGCTESKNPKMVQLRFAFE